MKMISNHDQIAGLPALVVRHFFANCDDPVSAADVQSRLNLHCQDALNAFERLICEGYLVTRAHLGGVNTLYKSRKAYELIRNKCVLPVDRDESRAILINVFNEIDRINASPEVAHRVDEVRLKGPLIKQPIEIVPFLDVEIVVSPIKADQTAQRGIEALAWKFYLEHGGTGTGPDEDPLWSVRRIEERLLDVDPHVCVRTVVSHG